MNKKILTLGLIAAMMIGIVGCGSTDQPKSSTDDQKKVVTDQKDLDVDNQMDKYDIIGRLSKIEGNKVDILMGDIMERVEVKNADQFYLGQTVGVKDGEMEEIKEETFDVRYTTMGEMIRSQQGQVKKIRGDKLTLTTDKGDMDFNILTDEKPEVGDSVTVEYKISGKNKDVIALYNEKQMLNLKVNEVKRTDNGHMVLATVDDKKMEYEVVITLGTVVNFNLSEVKKGDDIKVYYDAIQESYPMGVDALKIIK